MDEEKAVAAEGLDSGPVCRHHWMIEAPSGPTSKGVCQKCGEVREFRNSLPDPPRDDDAFSHFYNKSNYIPGFKNWDVYKESTSFSESYE